jgi:ubiquinone/menaquinone biosynthesis C-methylase UbiE
MIVVEPAKSFITEAKKKLGGGKNNNIFFINGMLEESVGRIKEIGDGLDYIIVGSLLHEVEEPEKLLRSIYEICSDKTVVHINVPNANSIHRLLAKEMGLIKDVHELSELQIEMQRHNVFDLTQLCEFVESYGFQVIDKGAYFPKLFSARQMEKMLDIGIVDETIFDGLNKMIRYLPEFGSEIYVQVKKKV